MKTPKSFPMRTCLLVGVAMLVTGCQKTDLFESNDEGKTVVEKTTEPNVFDFSTTQSVQLKVDYSANPVYGPVFFSVYGENPFEVSVSDDGYQTMTLRDDVSPVYENYTDAKGVFSRTIELPAYATHLYVVSGDFTVSEQLMETEVSNGKATAAVTRAAGARSLTRGATGTSTNDLTPLWNISLMDNNWTKGERVFKDWLTTLGTWNSESGRPDYVNTNVDEKLKFTEEEFASVYTTATTVLNSNRQCSDEIITQADLELVKDSEVGITMLGGNTCWHSTLGYYYYTGNTPSRADLNIVMLFPNTQDGHWVYGKQASMYNGNIGVERGDVVQLMYYPNIASGSTEGATPIFPKGTKLGFILKTNGWGMQKTVGNKKYHVQTNYGNRKYNNWGASTDGLSYFVRGNTQDIHYDNPEGRSRTAKFQCTTPNKHTYAIVSFEDAFNDKNYSDVVFALKPMDAFQKLPDPEDKVVQTKGVYCFEDMWPSKGDYDLNDAVVAFKHTKTFHKLFGQSDFKVVKEVFSLTTYLNYVKHESGLAMRLKTPATPSKVVMKKVKDGNTEEVSFTKDEDVYLVTDHIMAEIGTEYVLELYYENGISDELAATAKPFLYRDLENGKRYEVHVVGETPTSKMDTSLFGTQDDLSDPAKGLYYVRASNYPFAFYLNNATVEDVRKLLLRENESKSIDQLYPGYLDWVKSKGKTNANWYKE